MSKLLFKIKIIFLAIIVAAMFTAPVYAAEKEKTVTIMFTGDLMCSPGMQEAAFDGSSYDFDYVFKYAKSIFSKADYVVGNLETNITENYPYSKDLYRVMLKPSLNSPIEYLSALKKAGFDGLVMANNHNCDYGADGIRDTIEAVEEYGFDHTGLYKSKSDDHYFMIEKNGFKIGILAYATYFNQKEDLLTDSQQKYMLSKLTQKKIEADVKALKEAGAEYIVAYNHCGTEYSQVAAARQTRYFNMMADAGVDYLIGSHPHVLQRADKIKKDGKTIPVMYSMGNFVSSLSNEHVDETLILSVTLEKTKNGVVKLKKHSYIPCYMANVWNEKQYVLIPKGYEDTASVEKEQEALTAFDNVKKVIEKKIKWR